MDSEDFPNYLYCPECDTSFKPTDTKKVDGSMDFSGAISATQIVQNIYRNDIEASLEEKAVVTSQITGLTQEQWFEGFKAGQLATALFHRSKENDGENGTKSERSSGEHKTGTRDVGKNVSVGKNSVSESSDPGAERRPRRIKEIVSGVEFFYASHLKVPDNIYLMAAEIVSGMEYVGINNFSFSYDGGTLSTVMSDFK